MRAFFLGFLFFGFLSKSTSSLESRNNEPPWSQQSGIVERAR